MAYHQYFYLLISYCHHHSDVSQLTGQNQHFCRIMIHNRSIGNFLTDFLIWHLNYANSADGLTWILPTVAATCSVSSETQQRFGSRVYHSGIRSGPSGCDWNHTAWQSWLDPSVLFHQCLNYNSNNPFYHISKCWQCFGWQSFLYDYANVMLLNHHYQS